MSHKHSAILILAILPFWHSAVSAEDNTKTYGSSFAPPVFQSVDPQGVDLVHGKMRISTPVMQIGEGQSRHERGLLWTGQAWSIIGQPSIWRDGSKYIVRYRGKSEEFNDRKSGYSGRKPVMGGKLTCNVTDPGNIATSCMYTDRDGDVVVFNGVPSNSVKVSSSYGTASLFLGNLGMYNAYVRSVNRPMQFFGDYSFDQLGPDRSADSGGTYNSGSKKLSLLAQSLTISTPNQNGKNSEDSYLRPKGVTQSITDANGSIWKYTFNDNRDLTRIDFPAGAASITIEYNKDNKVEYVKTAAGTWIYQYRDQDNEYAFTTIIAPDSNRKMVRYHKESGIVTNYYENYDSVSQAFRRETKYELDGNFRVTKVIYPEQNYTTYTYDSRGNVTEKVSYPKPGSTVSSQVAFISTKSEYSSDCQYYTTCNQPVSITDELKRVTSFEYSSPKKARINSPWGNGDGYDYEYGPNGPIKITLPKVSSSGVTPEVVLSYENGRLIEKVECREKSPCLGTADAVITSYKYKYADSSGLLDLSGLIELAITADGKTLRTCYGLDNNGRRISETPPAAEISACPSDITTALEPKNTPPSAGGKLTPPVWPDGTTSDDTSNPTNPNPNDPGGGGDPCTRRAGYQCE